VLSAARRSAIVAAVALFAACDDGPREATVSRPTTTAADRVEPTPTIDPSVERALGAPRVARMMSRCRVTRPNHSTPPGEKPSPQFHGADGLWTVLPSGSVVVGGPHELQPDGSIAWKFPWWRGVRGRLRITGRRLDAPGPPVRASIPSGYGPTGFQSTAIIFPTEGCWQVTASAAGARMSLVTLVIKAEPQ
jgi:hypothetical protein